MNMQSMQCMFAAVIPGASRLPEALPLLQNNVHTAHTRQHMCYGVSSVLANLQS